MTFTSNIGDKQTYLTLNFEELNPSIYIFEKIKPPIFKI